MKLLQNIARLLRAAIRRVPLSPKAVIIQREPSAASPLGTVYTLEVGDIAGLNARPIDPNKQFVRTIKYRGQAPRQPLPSPSFKFVEDVETPAMRQVRTVFKNWCEDLNVAPAKLQQHADPKAVMASVGGVR
jgi:hypothetical protein